MGRYGNSGGASSTRSDADAAFGVCWTDYGRSIVEYQLYQRACCDPCLEV